MSAKTTLRELLKKGPVYAPCVYDCISAKMVEEAGFEAMCLSGAELAASYRGLPDIGLMTLSDLEDNVRRIAAASPLPMIVDIDTGFGNELNTIETCKRIAAAGAMAVHLEDQTFPKRCGHLRGKQVIAMEDYISKVKAAVYALQGTDCMLIARTDAFAVNGKEDAIARACAAIEAGADMTLIEATDSVEAIAEIGKRVPGLKMFGMNANGVHPQVTGSELEAFGYHLITMHYTCSAAIHGMREFGRHCFADKDDAYVYETYSSKVGPIPLHTMFGIHEWLQLGAQFNHEIQDAKPLEER